MVRLLHPERRGPVITPRHRDCRDRLTHENVIRISLLPTALRNDRFSATRERETLCNLFFPSLLDSLPLSLSLSSPPPLPSSPLFVPLGSVLFSPARLSPFSPPFRFARRDPASRSRSGSVASVGQLSRGIDRSNVIDRQIDIYI